MYFNSRVGACLFVAFLLFAAAPARSQPGLGSSNGSGCYEVNRAAGRVAADIVACGQGNPIIYLEPIIGESDKYLLSDGHHQCLAVSNASVMLTNCTSATPWMFAKKPLHDVWLIQDSDDPGICLSLALPDVSGPPIFTVISCAGGGGVYLWKIVPNA
jgi:hypothetical protein